MKLWKKIAVCSTLALSCVAFSGCNCSGKKQEVAVDLDGDGIISDWEELFEKQDNSSRVLTVNNIIEISSFDELKAINDKIDESNYYKLTKDINCNGEELNINLGKSVLFGNNKVIKNFKLKEIGYTTGEGQEESHIEANIYGFIYNGVAIYDLRLFVGYQNIEINNLNTWSYVSPIVNVATVDNVIIKGKLNVKRVKTEGLAGDNKVDISMGVACLDDISAIVDDKYIVPGSAEDVCYMPNISNIQTIGEINYVEDEGTNAKVRIGSITSHVSPNGMIYGAVSSVNIIANSSGALSVGGIVGENDDLVTTCEYTGEISTTYLPNSTNYIGGIAGRNYTNGELKNCVVSGKISFDADVTTSMSPEMHVGGIVGRNIGVVDYVENNGSMDITNAINIQVGGICGSSEYAIFSNIINRANILLTKCQSVYVAEICGYSKYGEFKQVVDMSTIKVENSEIVSSIKLGMVTIFEDFTPSSANLTYNAEFTPTFNGILMAGNVTINQKKVADASTNFEYNLGLRNPYEFEVIGEDGQPIKTRREDAFGNPVDENGDPLEDGEEEIWDTEMDTQLPDMYQKLYFVSDSYFIKKYTIAGDESAPVQDYLDFTYAKRDKDDIVRGRPNTQLNVSFFVQTLGFKYGLNHNEIDLGKDDSAVDINTISFTLNTDRSLTKYFEDKQSNGELAVFDNCIDEILTYDSEADRYSEIYSYFNHLLLSNTTEVYESIKVSHRFASSQDEKTIDDTISLQKNFANNIAYVISLIVGVKPEISELSSDTKNIEDNSSADVEIRYENLEISDDNYRYRFTFQINQMAKAQQTSNYQDNYLVYLQYSKVNKY